MMIVDANKKDVNKELLTGFSVLDDELRGFRKGQLTILAGRPRMGCTTLAFIFVKNILSSNVNNVAYFSLNKSKEYLNDKIVGIEDLSNLIISDNQHINVYSIMEKAIEFVQFYNVSFIIIDKLQSLHPNKEVNYENIVRSFQILAKSLNIPILLLSGLYKKLEHRRKKRPRIEDLLEFGFIEKYADVVMFLYRPAYYGFTTDDYGNDISEFTEIMVEKNRNGNYAFARLKFNKETSIYKEVEHDLY